MSNSIYKKICGIYKITSPSGRVYIGQSVNIIKRFTVYKRLECKGQRRLYPSLIKYGYEKHIFEIIEEVDIKLLVIDEKLLNKRERYWQDEYDVLGESGLNCRLTETDDKKCITSDETKNKIRISNTGKKQSKEQIEKRNITNTGRKNSEESIKNMRNAAIGRKMSYEARLKMSINKRDSGKTIQKYSLDGDLIKEATINTFKEEGYQVSQISRCCTGKAKTHKGFIWKYR